MNADTFGEWIKQRRKKLDLTQEGLAQQIGCSVSAIRKIESDQRRPSKQIAELLALHLEVPPEERTLFLKIARGEGSIQRLKDASTPAEKLVADPQTFSSPSNIPASTSPFIGRQQERESLASMLTDPRQRLITILGPGGIGKTRLAIEAATTQLKTFDEQVYFIQLAAFNAVDSILPAIASTLNIPSSNTDELKTRLADYLRDKNVLLVLDNFEHLIEGAVQVSDLLQKTSKLKILVTSRERLNLQGEWTFELSGLTVPPKEDEGKAMYSALQLFEFHAARIRPDIKLTGKEREAAIRICQRVDGMPLAIELAAAWVNVLSCEEIADEIERGFDFLSSTLRDVPERHRSLRAVFEHSWKRLTESEQSALSRLTIFQGGFSHEAAESVLGAGRSVLSSLVSKSLLRRSSNGRFDLHEVIRQYAVIHLDDESALRKKHSQYYLRLFSHPDDVPFGSESDLKRIRDLRVEYGNLQLAWGYAVKHKMFGNIDKALDSFWLICALNGWFQEGLDLSFILIDSIRGKVKKTPSEKTLLARAIMSAIGHLARMGELESANQLSAEVSELLQDSGEIEYLSNVLISHARIASVMGKHSDAHALANKGTELAALHENRWIFGLAHVNHGDVYAMEGNYERARELIQRGLSIYEGLGNVHSMVAFALNKLGFVLIHLGQFDEADKILHESLRLNAQLLDRWGESMALGRLGLLALHKGELANAKTLFKKSLVMFTELGMRWDISWVLMNLGKVAIASEEWQEAEQLLRRSLKLALVCHAIPQAIDAALELAECFIHQGKVNEALKIILPALQHSSSTDSARQRADELMSVLTPDEMEKRNIVEPLEIILARFVD